MTRPIRIANCSGFYGDRLSAPRELLDGPDRFDVLTGDYLAELTMLILWKARQKDPSAGYAGTFVRQMEDALASCLERGVKVVTNAGGLNPRGLCDRLLELAARSGLAPRIAVVEGDDIVGRLAELRGAGVELPDDVVTANAYLGGWGIARALDADADVVVCGRVTDASLAVGPAAWWHGWRRDDWDALAGAVVAGHILECGPQATGGNYPFLDELRPGPPGFPIAEIETDGSSVITKQPGTGGAVTVGTVTAQLLYEIDAPPYRNPDVIAHFDTIGLEQRGPDRVRVAGVRGSAPPDTLKVACNRPGGYRNTMTMVITGLDVDAKAEHAVTLLFGNLGGREQFESVDVQLVRHDRSDAPTNEEATALLRITVKDAESEKVGRRFSSAVTELALASYAGFFTTTPPTPETAFGVYRAAYVPVGLVHHRVRLPGGERAIIPPTPTGPVRADEAGSTRAAMPAGPSERRPLGAMCGARSGDKGGDANVGLWAFSDAGYAWLAAYLTVDRFRTLLEEAATLAVERYQLPNLRALNFVVRGLLGDGVASSVRFDPQAKGLGEYLRSRLVDLPISLASDAMR
jgi:hypothetical protein